MQGGPVAQQSDLVDVGLAFLGAQLLAAGQEAVGKRLDVAAVLLVVPGAVLQGGLIAGDAFLQPELEHVGGVVFVLGARAVGHGGFVGFDGGAVFLVEDSVDIGFRSCGGSHNGGSDEMNEWMDGGVLMDVVLCAVSRKE